MRHIIPHTVYQISPVGDDPYYNVEYKAGKWVVTPDEMADEVEVEADTLVEVVVGEAITFNEVHDLAAAMKKKNLHYEVTCDGGMVGWFSDESVSFVDYLDDEPDWLAALDRIVRGEQFLYKITKSKVIKLGKLQQELGV